MLRINGKSGCLPAVYIGIHLDVKGCFSNRSPTPVGDGWRRLIRPVFYLLKLSFHFGEVYVSAVLIASN